jgi:hypothetical protein
MSGERKHCAAQPGAHEVDNRKAQDRGDATPTAIPPRVVKRIVEKHGNLAGRARARRMRGGDPPADAKRHTKQEWLRLHVRLLEISALSRAMATSSASRPASARATARPSVVIR